MPYKTSKGTWKWGNLENSSKQALCRTVYGIWKKNGSHGSFSKFWHKGKVLESIYDEVVEAIHESRIDFAEKQLNPDIWYKEDDEYYLKETVKEEALKIKDKFEKLSKYKVESIRLVGSNTSTQYKKDSDLDFHISINTTNLKEIEAARKLIVEHIKGKYYYKKYPFEIYVQDNIFQDLASIGCYDVLNDTWLVGPDLVPNSFNPYIEFIDIFGKVEVSCRECDIEIGKLKRNILDYKILKDGLSKISSNKKQEVKKLLEKKLKEIFDTVDTLSELKADIRDERKATSTPESEAEAKRLRKNKKWQKADAAFKMIAKYGYLQLISDLEQIKDSKQRFLDRDIKDIEKII